MGPETIGRLPFRTGRKYSPVLAVTVVSSCSQGGVSLFGECFCWQLFIFVCLFIFVSHTHLRCVPAHSVSLRGYQIMLNISRLLLPSPWCVAIQRMTQLIANSSPEPSGCNFHGKVMLKGHLCLFNPKGICCYLALGYAQEQENSFIVIEVLLSAGIHIGILYR